MGYGVPYYVYAILLPKTADTLDPTLAGIFGALSLALYKGGFMSPIAGILTDPFGGRLAMTDGALVAASLIIAIWTSLFIPDARN